MKNIKLFLIPCILLLVTSCKKDFLDRQPDDMLNLNDVFTCSEKLSV